MEWDTRDRAPLVWSVTVPTALGRPDTVRPVLNGTVGAACTFVDEVAKTVDGVACLVSRWRGTAVGPSGTPVGGDIALVLGRNVTEVQVTTGTSVRYLPTDALDVISR